MPVTPTPERPAFMDQQLVFAAHIRDPEANPPPADVPERRMAIYRELFFNNLEGLLAGGFPVLRRITPDARWRNLARDFYARHRCHTPLFLEIGREFLDYLARERAPDPEDPPFLEELAHYEWVELALHVSDADPDEEALLDPGESLTSPLRLSPLAWNLRYRFPVQRIGPDYQPREPGASPTCLLVHRDRGDQVRFLETNPVTHALLDLFGEEPGITGGQALERVAEALAHPDPEAVLRFGRDLLEDLGARGVLLRVGPRAGPRPETERA